MAGPEIQRLSTLLSKLPGLGPRSGRRITLHLLKKKDQVLRPLIDALEVAEERITTCQICFNMDTMTPCQICQDHRRVDTHLCIVENVDDLWAIERAQVYRGRYHVLGGVLSAIQGVGPAQLTIGALLERLTKSTQVEEVVLALNATLDGQSTMHYLAECLKNYPCRLSTLAQGMPIGGELDYLDDGTLNAAFQSRRIV